MSHNVEHVDQRHSVTVIVTESEADRAIVVFIDTNFEPDGSDGSRGLRVYVNDGDAFEGVPFPHTAVTTAISANE